MLIHECTHRLVFKRKAPNFITGLIANLPLFFPSIAPFQKYHLKHHAFQGVYELDADVPSLWEARLIGHSAFGKALWLLFYPFFQALRPMRMKEVQVLQTPRGDQPAVQVVVNVAVYYFLGPKALAYLAMSFFFSIGLHPLGARWIQRHYLTGEGEQETFSYYGFLNAVTFNVGYHNEHHDFPVGAVEPAAEDQGHRHPSSTSSSSPTCPGPACSSSSSSTASCRSSRAWCAPTATASGCPTRSARTSTRSRERPGRGRQGARRVAAREALGTS